MLRSDRVLAGVWIVLLACFIGLALRASTANVLGIDVTLERWVQSLPEIAGDVFSLPNWLGNGQAVRIVTLLAAVIFIFRRDLQAATLVLLTYVPGIFNDLTKLLVNEP